ncbi:helix-turn-helix domain-containing protein [Nocardia sp. NPDC051832]|uniref:TetR/AcrR family transcriptional regulator n=1 Tax=Nocardia sp. NPDC051832 TaxID=3155673 RepID=UPI00341B7FEB
MSERVDWLAGGPRGSVALERIEAAAAELFLEHGIDTVGIADIAARAGCSRATLYRHAGGKSELVHRVLTRAASTVAERVAAAVEPYRGARRAVEAILASVAAIRADPALAQWLSRTRAGATDELLTTAPELRRVATALTRIAPDDEAAQWIVRVVLSLLTWPAADAAAERRMVERFVGPLFRTPDGLRG